MDIHIYQCREAPNTFIHQCFVHANGRIILDLYSYPNPQNSSTPLYIQAIVLNDNRSIVGFSTVDSNSKIFRILEGFMKKMGGNPINTVSDTRFTFVKRKSVSYDFILFQTPTGIFRAELIAQPFHTTVKVGGSRFMSCVEIFVSKKDIPHLSQIYSEPECWEDMEKGETVEMIKGSLQFVQSIFNVNEFNFEDKSQVDCGITNIEQMSPRKLDKPISLTHLSLVTTGKTWYERHFNARLRNIEDAEKDTTIRKILYSPIEIPFNTFTEKAYLTREQITYLRSLFERSKTWFDFFKSIPKDKRCTMMFNWTPFFVDNKLFNKFKLREKQWYISVGSLTEPTHSNDDQDMVRTSMYIITDPHIYGRYVGTQGGGKKHKTKYQTRNRRSLSRCITRKNRLKVLEFSNCPRGHTM